jgi:hypothetical protein
MVGEGMSEAVMPNPSIERTCPGKPGHASHVKRLPPHALAAVADDITF